MSRSGIARLKRQAFWQFETGIHFSLQQRIHFSNRLFFSSDLHSFDLRHHFGLFEMKQRNNQKFVG
jgi:hypothetical protein